MYKNKKYILWIKLKSFDKKIHTSLVMAYQLKSIDS